MDNINDCQDRVSEQEGWMEEALVYRGDAAMAKKPERAGIQRYECVLIAPAL